jgi:coenzyme F420-reducing hydrogenase delta subunit
VPFLIIELGLETARVETIAISIAEQNLHLEGVEALDEGTYIHNAAIVAKSGASVNL